MQISNKYLSNLYTNNKMADCQKKKASSKHTYWKFYFKRKLQTHFNKDMNKLSKSQIQTCLSRRSPVSQAKGQLREIPMDSKADEGNTTLSKTARAVPDSAGLYLG